MIKLFGRMLPMLARANGAAMVPATEPVDSRFRVMPHDIDINLHLNNGRYLQLIDLNRAEWLIRTGIWAVIRRNRWKPILGSVAVQYRRELRLWDVARIETRLLGWDERWTYLEHRVRNGDGRSVALSLAKAGFRSHGRWIDPEDLRAQLPYPLSPLVLPDHARALLAFDDAVDGRHQPQLRALA
ncbi:thioesterase family protein [Sandarakinorhabdus rubra]|uniref:thioesterase family protein n=1 Tax=Sandarakinorhabdus rubra TaxID=2672568 RepID=UPI0013DCE600|nr:thioesterase family protein [Sandarakinorhabdus rubra]